jgi:hypothetical protein
MFLTTDGQMNDRQVHVQHAGQNPACCFSCPPNQLMENQHMKIPLLTFFLLLALIAGSGIFAGCETDSAEYVRLAKTTFEKLVKNEPTAGDRLDWNNLTWNGDEIGRSYMSLNTDYEKAQYKTAIIEKISRYFASHGWDVTNVLNWKVQSKGVESAIVTANAPGGTLTIWFQKVELEKKISRMTAQ